MSHLSVKVLMRQARVHMSVNTLLYTQAFNYIYRHVCYLGNGRAAHRDMYTSTKGSGQPVPIAPSAACL